MGRQHPSRNRGDVAPLVEFLQQKCCRNRCSCNSHASDRRQQNRFLSEPLWRNIGSSQMDCTTNGTGTDRYPLDEVRRHFYYRSAYRYRMWQGYSTSIYTRTSGFHQWKGVEVLCTVTSQWRVHRGFSPPFLGLSH